MSSSLPSISPLAFFECAFSISQYDKKCWEHTREAYFLPRVCSFNGEDGFADLGVAWSAEGLFFYLSVHQPAKKSFYPELKKGDALELFIDTRNDKGSHFNTRFCHHFFFLPEECSGTICGEITRFRGEDAHALALGEDLKLDIQKKGAKFALDIFLPKRVLHGYDPEQFREVGFSYRVHRYGGEPQDFNVQSDEFRLEKTPSLWAIGRLNAYEDGAL